MSTRSEYEESQILRSAMDGTGERVLIGDDLRYPTSLVVDELTERVYWLESYVQFAIKSVQFNGKNKKVISRLHFWLLCLVIFHLIKSDRIKGKCTLSEVFVLIFFSPGFQ